MIEKYTRPEMGRIWSEGNKYRCWLAVEIAVAEGWAARGRIPADALPAIRRATVEPGRITDIEQETQHDVIAFLRNVAESVGPDARWVHLGLTSSDVIDTALALQLSESIDLLQSDLDSLTQVVGNRALQERATVMMGRTHNVHAEPITFGFKLAVWYGELQRHRSRLAAVRQEVAVAKIAGAVGTHANVPPDLEVEVADRLGLGVEPAATQVVQRDRHAAYVFELALLACSLDKMATELRNLQHTEILEVEEPFRQGQQGSSAMPHKRNPILNERISGLARVMRGYVVPAMENVVLWHERDISNSSVERVVLPDASILCDYMLTLFTRIVSDMKINRERMEANVASSHGLIFSEKLLTALIDAGMSRSDAYSLVQRDAMESWRTGRPLRDIVLGDSEVMSRLLPDDVEQCFNIGAYLQTIDVAFERLHLTDSR